MSRSSHVAIRQTCAAVGLYVSFVHHVMRVHQRPTRRIGRNLHGFQHPDARPQTLNPSAYCIYYWPAGDPTGVTPGKLLAFLVLQIGWFVCVRTASVSMGIAVFSATCAGVVQDVVRSCRKGTERSASHGHQRPHLARQSGHHRHDGENRSDDVHRFGCVLRTAGCRRKLTAPHCGSEPCGPPWRRHSALS